MKTVKIIFFTGFLLLWSISVFNQKPTVDVQSHFNILQSPLSDDETNPINKHYTEIAEFDLEDHKQNKFLLTIERITPFIYTNIIAAYSSFVSVNAPYQQLSSSYCKETQQSLLQVFRI